MDTNVSLRECLRDLDIKIVDLAKMLDISRPTLYGYINHYDEGKLDKIDSSYIALFNYITQNKFINANNVMVYIARHILIPKNNIDSKLALTGNAQKDAFIHILLESDCFDEVIGYLYSCHGLLEKGDLSDEGRAFLQPLCKLYQNLGLTLKFDI